MISAVRRATSSVRQHVLALLALVDRLRELAIDPVREQRAQSRALALRKGLDDHGEGAAGTLGEALGIEARIGESHLGKAGFQGTIGQVRRGGFLSRRLRRRLALRHRHHGVVAAHGRWSADTVRAAPLMARAPAQDVAQAEGNERRHHRKEDNV